MKPFRAIAICLVLLSAFAYAKERDWQEGKLIDITNEPYTEGSVWAYGGGAHKERIRYVIDAGTYIYTATHTHFTRESALKLTVNAKVKFAIEKQKVWIVDEDGKEHELKFEKKALKEPR